MAWRVAGALRAGHRDPCRALAPDPRAHRSADLARGLLQPHHGRVHGQQRASRARGRGPAGGAAGRAYRRRQAEAGRDDRGRADPRRDRARDHAGGRGLRGPARRRAPHRPPAPDLGDRRGAVRAGAGGRGHSPPPRRRSPASATSPVRWPTPPAPSRAGRACRCWPRRLCSGSCEGAVYLAVAKAVELDISATGALYLVALTNFVAALPAAPGSIGTFDAAVAFGAKALGGCGVVVISLSAAAAVRPLRADHGGRPGRAPGPLRRLGAAALGGAATDQPRLMVN